MWFGVVLFAFALLQNKALQFCRTCHLALQKLVCYCLERYLSEVSWFFLSQLKLARDLLLGMVKNSCHLSLSRRPLR